MKIGTKSILFGVHQFLVHPIVVALAWRKLHGSWPRREELVAIVCHDIGYWGCPEIDGPVGRLHPERGARIARRVARRFGWSGGWAAMLVLKHSREYAKIFTLPEFPAADALRWPDKYSICYEPKWFFLLRGKLSGEIKEFKARAIAHGHLPENASDGEWFTWYQNKTRNLPQVKQLLSK